MGSRGVLVAQEDGSKEIVPAFSVSPVDTTAAGDAFNGGFAVGLVKRMNPIESAGFASAVAAISVTRAGAQPSMPNLQEVEQFIAGQSAQVPRRDWVRERRHHDLDRNHIVLRAKPQPEI